MRPSQNLPFLLRIFPPFQQIHICEPPRIYPSLLEYPPPFIANWYLQTSQNLILPARITPPPFSTTICDPPRIYPSLPESTPPSQQLYDLPIIHPFPPRIYPPFNNYMRHTEYQPPSQNIPPISTNLYVWPSQNMPPFQQIYMCDPPKIYSPLSEYTPLFNNYIIIQPSNNPPLLPRIYPSPFNNYMRHSQKLPLPLRIYPSSIFYNYMRYSKNLNSITACGRLFLNYMCMWEILALAPRIEKYSRRG